MRALICLSLLLCLDAFSSREPVSTSLENALLYLDAFPSPEPVSTSLQNAPLVPGYRCGKSRHVAFRALVEDLLAFDHIEHGFGDIGGVIADPFDVLGAEHQVDAERDVARIFHHIGQQF